MEYVRFKKDDITKYGIKRGNKVREIDTLPFDDNYVLGRSYKLSQVELLAPCNPGKIVCVGLNYSDHAAELGMEVPQEPKIFLKPATAAIGPTAEIKYPKMSQQVDYEAELAFVVKKECKDITVQEAEDYILGYCCFNDVTARDLQQIDGQWTRAKSFDTFAPFGPTIVSEVDVSDLEIKLLKNGEVKQESTTANMIFSPAQLLSFISKIMTLKPGDLIATGTPPGVGPMESGDQIEVQIEKLGSLKNNLQLIIDNYSSNYKEQIIENKY